jgi:hypothetical protein
LKGEKYSRLTCLPSSPPSSILPSPSPLHFPALPLSRLRIARRQTKRTPAHAAAPARHHLRVCLRKTQRAWCLPVRPLPGDQLMGTKSPAARGDPGRRLGHRGIAGLRLLWSQWKRKEKRDRGQWLKCGLARCRRRARAPRPEGRGRWPCALARSSAVERRGRCPTPVPSSRPRLFLSENSVRALILAGGHHESVHWYPDIMTERLFLFESIMRAPIGADVSLFVSPRLDDGAYVCRLIMTCIKRGHDWTAPPQASTVALL